MDSRTRITAAKADDVWQTAVFYNNELAYLRRHGMTESEVKQFNDFHMKAVILADCCNDFYSPYKSVAAKIEGTKNFLLGLANRFPLPTN